MSFRLVSFLFIQVFRSVLFSCFVVFCVSWLTNSLSYFIDHIVFFFFLFVCFFHLTHSWGTYRWPTTPSGRDSNKGSHRTCSSKQTTVRIHFDILLVSFFKLASFSYNFCLVHRNGVAGKLPSPPLSPLLNHPIENNNNINNNMDGNPSAKSSNGQPEGEIRRKVISSSSVYLVVATTEAMVIIVIFLFDCHEASSDGKSLLYCQRASDDRTHLQKGSWSHRSGKISTAVDVDYVFVRISIIYRLLSFLLKN